MGGNMTSELPVIRPESGLAKPGRERKRLLTTVIQKNDRCTLAFNAPVSFISRIGGGTGLAFGAPESSLIIGQTTMSAYRLPEEE